MPMVFIPGVSGLAIIVFMASPVLAGAFGGLRL
jgi:hypothetical protein